MANERVPNIRAIVSDSAAHEFFPDTSGPIELATFPWWVPMELLAAGSLLRHGDTTARVDPYILRAVRGVAHYFRNDRIGGLCYQNIGDRFFEWVDIPPATPTLDLMHSHRSLRIFLRHSLIDRPSDALDAVPTEETT
jgi:hypothetical protein